MKLIAPDYYNEFSCIADKCAHSCCVGWEIDIDEDTFEYYKSVTGEIGERLNMNIIYDGVPHFLLGGNDRCPFLNDNNLCDIILNLGEDSLCQICADHPRYRNFFSDRTEIGLGLTCEAAAKLILTRRQTVKLTVIEDDGEKEQPNDEEQSFYSFREKLFEIIQNRKKPIDRRAREMLSAIDAALPEKTLSEWAEIYLGLERLDASWTDVLNGLKNPSTQTSPQELEIPFEQLLIYFLYRHTAEGVYDGRLRERVLFAALSYHIIRALCAARGSGLNDLIEIARMYSSEIEYCEENTEKLLEILNLP